MKIIDFCTMPMSEARKSMQYMGKPLSELSREELECALVTAHRACISAAESHMKTLSSWEISKKARRYG